MASKGPKAGTKMICIAEFRNSVFGDHPALFGTKGCTYTVIRSTTVSVLLEELPGRWVPLSRFKVKADD